MAEIEVAARFERTNTLPPGSGQEDWKAYFQNYAKLREIKRRQGGYHIEIDEDGNEIVVEDELEEVDVFTIIQTAHEIDISELPQIPKAILTRAKTVNFKVWAQHTRTYHSDLLYKADSKQDAEEKHNKGDVRTPAHERDHFFIKARASVKGQIVIAFTASWSKRLVPKASNSFEGATAYDPVSGRFFIAKATPFEDWFGVFCPKPPPKKTKAQLAAEAELEEEKKAGIWHG